jgi:hypothetical protein
MFIESADIQHAYVQWLDAEYFQNTPEGVRNIQHFPLYMLNTKGAAGVANTIPRLKIQFDSGFIFQNRDSICSS